MSGRTRAGGPRRAGLRVAPAPTATTVPDATGRAAALRRLELEVTRRLDGLVSGEYLGRLPGPGSDRVGARSMQPGDDARRIDWSLTARSLEPHVRTTDADRELETWILADRSASLDFGTAEREKRDVVLAAAAAFGALTTRGGNRLGMLVSGGPSLERVPPAATRRAALAALARLYDTPRRDGPPGDGADLHDAIAHLDRLHQRRGQVVVVSDFLTDADWGAPLCRLALRHQVVCVQVVDPREERLPAVGLLTVVDPESGRTMAVQTASSELRERYAAAAARRQEAIARTIAGAAAEHLVLRTDRDWLTDVARFVLERRTRRATRLSADVRSAP
jgi:uncharacterized protein (DUF58 family)